MTEPSVNPKIVDLLQKLVAHQKSAEHIGNLEEAAAFAGKVAELLSKHNLTMTEVETYAYIKENPIGKTTVTPREAGQRKYSYRVQWQERLANVISSAHFCQLVVIPGSNTVHFVGRESDRTVTSYVYCCLTRVAIRLCKAEWEGFIVGRRKQKASRQRRFQLNFFEGFVIAIARRYQKVREETGPATSGALVYIAVTKAQIREFLADSTKDASSFKKRPRLDSLARLLGYQQGRDVDLPSKGLEKESKTPTLLLGQ